MTGWMDELRRVPWGIPAGVVEDDGENGERVALRDPVYRAGNGKEIASIADNVAHERGRVARSGGGRVVSSELDTEGGAA